MRFQSFFAVVLLFISSYLNAQTPTIQAAGATDVCSSCVTLDVTNPVNGFTYEWFVGNYSCGASTGAASYGFGTQIQACATGEFFCVATDPNSIHYPSNPIVVRALPGSLGSTLLPKPYDVDPISCLDSATLCIPSVFYQSFPNTTFAWYKNGILINGATGSSYVASSTGLYSYSVNSSCASALSAGVNFYAPPALPQFTALSPVPACTQDTVILEITNPNPNYQYTWERFFIGTSYITIGTGATLHYAIISNAYDTLTVRVKQLGGACIRTSAELKIPVQTNSPTITALGNLTFCGGNTVTLSGYPGSPNPGYSFQWYKNGNLINGATGVTYNAGSTGSYTVATTAACGTNVSNPVSVTTLPAPIVTITASGPAEFCVRDSVELVSSVSGSGPFTYQWRKYGNYIGGAVASNYEAKKTGKYTVRVTDSNGCTRTSNNIVLSVFPLPVATITAGGPTSFCAGGSVDLTANAGTGYSYQWKRNTNLISGANGITYNATLAAKYRCIVTNSYGCTRTSNTIQVFVPCREAADELNNDDMFTVSAFPNPSQGDIHFEIHSKAEGLVQVHFYDLTGRIVEASVTPSDEGSFDVSGLSPGIYIAELLMGDQRRTIKVIKTE
ncbi:MAG TPA: T9SS type A sorting domain-containing protein [Bacteroidia bacterium]|nr:T9SS type A sorting domain-containing protein [Bacteroidia bacterium]